MSVLCPFLFKKGPKSAILKSGLDLYFTRENRAYRRKMKIRALFLQGVICLSVSFGTRAFFSRVEKTIFLISFVYNIHRMLDIDPGFFLYIVMR